MDEFRRSELQSKFAEPRPEIYLPENTELPYYREMVWVAGIVMASVMHNRHSSMPSRAVQVIDIRVKGWTSNNLDEEPWWRAMAVIGKHSTSSSEEPVTLSRRRRKPLLLRRFWIFGCSSDPQAFQLRKAVWIDASEHGYLNDVIFHHSR